MNKDFKVGDKVTILSWDYMARKYGIDSEGDIAVPLSFVKGMRHLCGRTTEITDANNVANEFKLQGLSWNFSREMLKRKREK